MLEQFKTYTNSRYQRVYNHMNLYRNDLDYKGDDYMVNLHFGEFFKDFLNDFICKLLTELVNKSITNYFIGFGIDHDATLLNAMGNSTNSSYHFIDKIEHSGFVYGEILHGIVYKLLFNVQIEVTNGFIYDYKNNMWVSSLNIGNIVSETSKIYHIISDNSSLCRALVKADQKVYDENGNEAIMSHGYSAFNEGATECLDKYIYRQKTMQLLYKVNNYNNNVFL
jgi:hypothetical protein